MMASPPNWPRLADFVKTAIRDWNESAGSIDVARTHLPALPETGLKLVEARPIIFAPPPKDFAWQWPKTFVPPHARRLADRGIVTDQ